MNDLKDIASGQSVLDDSPFYISRVSPSSHVLSLPWIDAGPNGEASAMPSSNEIQTASLSRSIKNCKILPKCSPHRGETSTVRTRCDDAKAPSDEMPVIDFESVRE